MPKLPFLSLCAGQKSCVVPQLCALHQGCQYGQGKSMEWHFQHGMSTLAISFQHGGYIAWRRVEINFQRTANMACVQKRSGV